MVKPNVRTSMSVPIGLLQGGACSLLTIGIICGFFAKLIDGGILPANAMNYGTTTALLCASILGAWITCARIREKPLLICLLSAGVSFLTLIVIRILFFEGGFHRIGVTALLLLGGSLIPALLVSRGRGVRKKNHKKYRSR